MTTSPERPQPTTRFPATDEFPTGPAVGEVVPDFALPDQHGRLVSLAEARREGRALVVFIRSTSW